MRASAQDIVAEARSWIGTPFHHMAELKGVGVDCGKFVFCVYRNVGLVAGEDFGSYAPDWMLARDNSFLEDLFRARLTLVEAPQPGDVMLFRVGRNYCHLAIITTAAPLAIVHASDQYRIVIEEQADRAPRIRSHLHDTLMGRLKGVGA